MKKYLFFLCILFLFHPLTTAQTPLGDTVVTQALRDSLTIDGEWETVPISDPFDLGGVLFITGGKVGVGTSTPEWKLHTYGSGVIINSTESTDNAAHYRLKTDSVNRRVVAMDSAEAIKGQIIFKDDKIELNGTSDSDDFVDFSAAGMSIGTETPSELIHVHKNHATQSSALLLTNDGSGGGGTDGLFVGYSTAAFFWNYENTSIGFATNNLQKMTLAADGNLGIGTSTPQTKLHIDDATDEVVFTVGEPNASVADTTGLQLAAWSDDNVYFDTKLGTTGRLHMRYGEGTETGSTNSWLTLNGGLVGMGTHTPSARLHIVNGGDENLLRLQNDDTAGDNVFIEMIPGGTGTAVIDMGSSDDTGIGGIRYANVDDVMVFKTGGSAAADRVYFDNEGHIGVGIRTPTSDIHILGTANPGLTIGASSGGGCLMIRDTDVAGWTECFTLNGVLSCTIDADGLCDGS